MNGAPPTKTMIVDDMAAVIRTVDMHAKEVNQRWGFNRLPHIVPVEWTQRFVDQKRKWEMACFECAGSPDPAHIERVAKHGQAMVRAYAKLEELALASGKSPAAPGTWEFELTTGEPIVLVRTRAEMGQVDREPKAQVWCLEEIGQIIKKFPELALVKDAFPQAEIIQMGTGTEVRELVDDALEDVPFG